MPISGYVQTLAVSRTVRVSVGHRGRRSAHARRDENTLGNDDRGDTFTRLLGSSHQSRMATEGLDLYRNLVRRNACNYDYLRRTHFGQKPRPIRWTQKNRALY